MHPVRKQRLFLVLFVVVFSTLAVGLMAYALRANINLFYPPGQIVSGEAPVDTRIRAGGCVRPGSVQRAQSGDLETRFDLTDGVVDFTVTYGGILPDLFAEGEAAVVNGTLGADGVFRATEVLAKHDEEYMPPEVADAMSAAGGDHDEGCGVMVYGP